MIDIYIFLISSLNFCCNVTRLDNTFQPFRAQVPLLHPSAQLSISDESDTNLFTSIYTRVKMVSSLKISTLSSSPFLAANVARIQMELKKE